VAGQELLVAARLASQANSGVCQTGYQAVVLHHHTLCASYFRLGEPRVCLGEVRSKPACCSNMNSIVLLRSNAHSLGDAFNAVPLAVGQS
jgi:hypothetical protein